MASNLIIWKRKFTNNPPSSPEFPGPLTPHPSGISNSLRGGGMDIFWNHTFWLLRPSTPAEFSLTFHGVGMDIFWNCTMICYECSYKCCGLNLSLV